MQVYFPIESGIRIYTFRLNKEFDLKFQGYWRMAKCEYKDASLNVKAYTKKDSKFYLHLNATKYKISS